MKLDGNVYRAVQALYAAIDHHGGYDVTIGREEDGSMAVIAVPRGGKAYAKRTGRGTTLTDAMLDLAGKMGLSLPRGEG